MGGYHGAVYTAKFEKFKKDWLERFGFSLYKELSEEDTHCLKSIRLPLYENYLEFDNLILNLTKVLIDYLNEREIIKRIKLDKTDVPGITKLEILLKHSTPYPKNVIPFFRNLQSLRSRGAAHQKGKGYKKIMEEMNLEDKSLIEAFEIILEKTICTLDELTEVIKSKSSNIF